MLTMGLRTMSHVPSSVALPVTLVSETAGVLRRGATMTVWLVRAGRYGERETLALEQGLSVIGWEEVPDLSGVTSRAALEELVRATYPDAGKGPRRQLGGPAVGLSRPHAGW